jgi:hypothetical protein
MRLLRADEKDRTCQQLELVKKIRSVTQYKMFSVDDLAMTWRC